MMRCDGHGNSWMWWWLVSVAIVVTVACTAMPAQAQEPWARLHGEMTEQAVRLVWELRGWAEGTVAFSIRRRQGMRAWETVAQRIVPGMWSDKALANVEPDATERARLQAELARRLREGKMQTVTPQQFLATVRQAPATFFQGLRREILADFDRALFLGLGCIDRNSARREGMEYGLFAVDRAGVVAPKPIATYVATRFTADDARLKVRVLQIDAGTAGMTLSWRRPEQNAQAWSIFGFRILRAPRGADAFSEVSSGVAGGSRVEDAWRLWTFVDASANPEVAYTYAVEPVNVFGTTLPTRTTADSDSRAKGEGQPSAPRLDALRQEESGKVTISWSPGDGATPEAVGFQVERLRLPGGEFAAISELFPPATRSFADVDPKTDQEAFAYRVAAVGASGAVSHSDVQVLVYVNVSMPPQPTGVQAEYVGTQHGQYVHVRWAPRASRDEITVGYALFVDRPTPGELVRQASIPMITGLEYVLPVNNLDSRSYRIGVAGVGSAGQVGPIAETSCQAPGLLPAVPTEPRVRLSAAPDLLVLDWQYPDDADLSGFRVHVNGEPMATEIELGEKARSWRFLRRTLADHYLFEIQAIFRTGRTSMPARVSWSPVQVRPEPPADFTATWIEQAEPGRIRLAWTPPGPDQVVNGYLLSVDAAEFGRFGPLQPIAVKTPGEYEYQAPTAGRTYSFQLRVIGHGGEKSLAAGAICLAPGRSLPPPVLARRTELVRAAETTRVRLRWSYPGADDLKGFRLHRDTQLVADESTLGPSAREWTSEPLPQDGRFEVAIEAVDTAGNVSERSASRVIALSP